MIDTVALRIKTLKQAMSGKLSEQKSEDGEAIPEGIVASDSSTDENAYAIPTSWRWVRVKDVVAKDIGGGTPSKAVPEYWNNGDISWATVKDFSNSENGYINETIDHITQEGFENSSANMVDEEAIVVCMRMALGKIVRVAKPMAINQDLRALWLKSFVEQDYFVYFYKTLKVEGRGTTVAGIKKDELMNYAFPVPPIKEQRRIIEKVNSIFEQLDIIDNLQLQYVSDLEVLKSKIIDAGIQGKLTEQLPEDGTAEELLEQTEEEKMQLIKEKKIKAAKALPEISEDEIPFEIPDNWKWVRLENITRKVFAGGDKPEDFQNEIDDVHPYPVVANGITDDGILGYSAKYTAEPETVTVAGRGTIGFSVYRDYKYCPIVRLIVVEPSAGVNPRYLRYVFQGMPAGSVGSSIPQLTVPMLKPKLIPLPPANEQNRIVARIDEVLEQMEMI